MRKKAAGGRTEMSSHRGVHVINIVQKTRNNFILIGRKSDCNMTARNEKYSLCFNTLQAKMNRNFI
jgi:hypothetical protein